MSLLPLSASFPIPPCEEIARGTINEAERKPSSDTKSVGNLTVNFPAPKQWEIYFYYLQITQSKVVYCSSLNGQRQQANIQILSPGVKDVSGSGPCFLLHPTFYLSTLYLGYWIAYNSIKILPNSCPLIFTWPLCHHCRSLMMCSMPAVNLFTINVVFLLRWFGSYFSPASNPWTIFPSQHHRPNVHPLYSHNILYNLFFLPCSAAWTCFMSFVPTRILIDVELKSNSSFLLRSVHWFPFLNLSLHLDWSLTLTTADLWKRCWDRLFSEWLHKGDLPQGPGWLYLFIWLQVVESSQPPVPSPLISTRKQSVSHAHPSFLAPFYIIFHC